MRGLGGREIEGGGERMRKAEGGEREQVEKEARNGKWKIKGGYRARRERKGRMRGGDLKEGRRGSEGWKWRENVGGE